MKTYCKDVDITRRDLISRCAYQCLQGKYTRRDVLELLSSQSGRSRSDLKRAYKKNGASAMNRETERVIDVVQGEILRHELVLKPIRYVDKVDSSSNKTRRIGIQDIKQQIYDYILLLGTNAKDLHRAVDLICDKVRVMKLRIKKTWRVFSVQGTEFVDIMGVRIYKAHTTIRDYVFRRIRRAYAHALRRIKQHLSVPGSLACRCASYYGLLKNTNSYKLRKRWQASLVMRVCKGVISRESKILASTAAA